MSTHEDSSYSLDIELTQQVPHKLRQLKERSVSVEFIRNSASISSATSSSSSSEEIARKRKRRLWRLGRKVDIFNFEPIPTSKEVSSKSSQAGSILLFLLFFLFVGYTSYHTLISPSPRVVTYSSNVNTTETYEAQDFAFGYFRLDQSNVLINDPQIFTYYLEQHVIHNSHKKKTSENYAEESIEKSKQIQLEVCRPNWVSINIDLLCPKDKVKLQGAQGIGEYVRYPVLQIIECNQTIDPSVVCYPTAYIDVFPRGRLLIFIKRPGMMNWSTKKKADDSSIMVQFFILPDQANRAETVVYREVITEKANYANRFQDIVSSSLQIDSTDIEMKGKKKNFLNSAGKSVLLTWSMILSLQQENQSITSKTLIDLLAQWGGMWEVLLFILSLAFLQANRKMFYKSKTKWDRFDTVVEVKPISRTEILRLKRIQEERDRQASMNSLTSESQACENRQTIDLSNQNTLQSSLIDLLEQVSSQKQENQIHQELKTHNSNSK